MDQRGQPLHSTKKGKLEVTKSVPLLPQGPDIVIHYRPCATHIINIFHHLFILKSPLH